MARRKGHVRDSRTALLDAAWEIFLERGIEAASVEAIVSRAELSKGTFFHFFPTKMAMLEAFCERLAEDAWREVGPLLEASDRDPLERLDAWLVASRARRLERPEGVLRLWSEATRDENAVLLKKLRALGAAILAPALTRLLADGNERGQFHVTDPEITAWILIDLGMAALTVNAPAVASGPGALGHVLRRANATIEAIERTLGAPPGSLHRVRAEEFYRLADPPRA